MSGLEAAASLFGSEDPHSDPFASLGSESQHTDAAHGASDDLFAANRTSSPAPGFLEEPQTYSEPVEHHNTWPETNSYDPAAHNVYSSPEQNYGTQQSAQDYGIHQSTQNYGEQWQNYSENNYSENNPYAAPAYANGQAPQAYNSYTPSQYDSASAASVYHTNPATTQSAYTPYVPPAQTQTYTPAPAQSYNSYAPPVQPQRANSPQSYSPASQPSYYPASQSYSPSVPAAASPQTTYNSYTPPVQPNYGVPSYSSPQNSFGYQNTSGAAVPPPPAPKAPLNRPKVSNAYDPPFPTTTSKKSRHASSSSQSQYSSFSPPAQPSGLPRPPPGGAEQVHTHPPPSVSSSSPHNKPPIMSSGYSSASNSRNGSIDRLPNTNGVSATFSAYAPPMTNSHEPSAPAQNYALPNNMARYDSYADMQPQNHNAPVGADPEPISLSEASGDSLPPHHRVRLLIRCLLLKRMPQAFIPRLNVLLL
ncbi:hypothetical protein BDP27DRAFT_42175 [Rhodocollybia butyracea]|uniref:Uncharacterized protein n=1 Tax=Rhodocollybia butyracea TaxID=206335 RepID=A0A9P5Q706_9AGAR|nr:hypothetical protein BDP27DRAFT_42175 [Rhodocollybia butyracea]